MVWYTYNITRCVLRSSLKQFDALASRPLLQASDAIATSKVVVSIVKLCHELGDMKQLNAHVQILAKRRGQLKQVRVAARRGGWAAVRPEPPPALSPPLADAPAAPPTRRPRLQAISDMVDACMAMLDSMPSREARSELLTALKSVTEGKVRTPHSAAAYCYCCCCCLQI